MEKHTLASNLRTLAGTYYSPSNCVHHYLHMAQKNFNDYLKGEEVWLKKYFYILRPLLAIQWIEQGYGVAPTAFGNLLEKVVPDGELKHAIEELIHRKSGGDELARGPRIQIISDYIEQQLTRLSHDAIPYVDHAAPYPVLDEIFRQSLVEAWNSNQTR